MKDRFTNVDLSKASPYRVTDRYELFCRSLLIDMNPTKAVRRTGCYSHKYAKQQAWRLMRNPIVLARIVELMEERSRSISSEDTATEPPANINTDRLMMTRDMAWLMSCRDV